MYDIWRDESAPYSKTGVSRLHNWEVYNRLPALHPHSCSQDRLEQYMISVSVRILPRFSPQNIAINQRHGRRELHPHQAVGRNNRTRR